MKELNAQLRHGIFHPYLDEDVETVKSFKDNKIFRVKVYGEVKERSLRQLGTYFSSCGFLAEQLSDHNNILSKGDIDFDVKTKVAKDNPWMIKRYKISGDKLWVEPLSISFANLKHLEACKYFDKAFLIMAEMAGFDTVEEFIAKVKSVYYGNKTAKNNKT